MTAATPSIDAEIAARRLLEARRTRDAQQLLSATIPRHPDRAALWLLRGLARHADAQWGDALADIETAMTLMPLPTAGTLALGDCYANTGRQELALIAYRHVLSSGPLPPDFYAGLYAGFRACGRADLAIQACRAACEAEPDNHEAMFAMAHAMTDLGYSSQYIASVLDEAVRLAPDRTVYRLSLALQLTRAGRCREAHQRLAEAPPHELKRVGCPCAARRLMDLCVWAGDAERAGVLCDVLVAHSERGEQAPCDSEGDAS